METERLYIRRYTKEDFPGFCELISCLFIHI